MEQFIREPKQFDEIKDKIISGVKKLAAPVIGTLTPRGANVIYKSYGMYNVTNDGITIANQMEFEDFVEKTIADMVRYASRKTNDEVGDGTTTTILFAQEFLVEGMKLRDSGMNPMVLTSKIKEATNLFLKAVDKYKEEISGNEDLYKIAMISSGSDKEIADNVLKAVKIAGIDGNIVWDIHNKKETEMKIDQGYLMDDGMLFLQCSTKPNKFEAEYNNVPVFITDKRIYNDDEVVHILETALKNGHRQLVIVARDFIGNSPNLLLTNHLKNSIKLLLIKDTQVTDENNTSLEDLANYLGIDMVTEKAGKLTTNVTIADFVIAKKVISNKNQTLFIHQNDKTEKYTSKIAALKEQIEQEKQEHKQVALKQRIGRMSNGTVSIYVGGNTSIEAKEKMFRYEDSVNATLNSKRYGYVVGGGITAHRAFQSVSDDIRKIDTGIHNLMEKVCTAPLRQLAINCDVHYPTLKEKVEDGIAKNKYIGYNAETEKFQDLKKFGIIEPVMVLKRSIENAMSVANSILSSNSIIINKEIKNEQSNKIN